MAEPTPEDLAERARRIGADGGGEQDVLGLIRDAEAGGDDHMAAVASQVVRWPTGPSQAPFPGVYDMATGRPAWHESNILMSVSVRIDGRLFTARKMFEPMLFNLQFGGTEDERFEDFVRYFLQHNFGGVATADDESYRYLRRKVWIVKPGDLHDLQRCARSYPEQGGQSTKDYLCAADREAMWPRCSAGFILRSAEAVKPNPVGFGRILGRIDVLGVCPCRCHRVDPYGASAKRMAERHGIPDFDEQQLDEVDDA